ncbi:MAG: ModD protein [Candidatus Electrothrix sp. GW3-4]|uniref:ModD protein n=1 Tax=Candidatus Electrothrix sp. GW3-4 TaxID=3126740 RepID=UPI0030CBFDB7
MIFFTTEEIEQWINEDAPLVDLTSHLLGLNNQPGILQIATRHPTRVALTEEAGRIFEILGCCVRNICPSGEDVPAQSVLLSAEGPAGALHRGWKVAMNLLEYMCGVATHTAEMVNKVREYSDIPLLVTRKHQPGLKKPLIKAILAGGAVPHRLGLSETILIFANHLNLLGGRAALPALLADMKAAACEQKITVECDDLDQAVQAAEAGTDAVQFDKVSPQDLSTWCPELKASFPNLVVLSAGGVGPENVQDYARTGVDGIVLSSVFHAKPADLGVTISLR